MGAHQGYASQINADYSRNAGYGISHCENVQAINAQNPGNLIHRSAPARNYALQILALCAALAATGCRQKTYNTPNMPDVANRRPVITEVCGEPPAIERDKSHTLNASLKPLDSERRLNIEGCLVSNRFRSLQDPQTREIRAVHYEVTLLCNNGSFTYQTPPVTTNNELLHYAALVNQAKEGDLMSLVVGARGELLKAGIKEKKH